MVTLQYEGVGGKNYLNTEHCCPRGRQCPLLLLLSWSQDREDTMEMESARWLGEDSGDWKSRWW